MCHARPFPGLGCLPTVAAYSGLCVPRGRFGFGNQQLSKNGMWRQRSSATGVLLR